jgi:hypothetical protein
VGKRKGLHIAEEYKCPRSHSGTLLHCLPCLDTHAGMLEQRGQGLHLCFLAVFL